MYRIVASKFQCPTIAHFKMIQEANKDCSENDKLVIAITNPYPKEAKKRFEEQKHSNLKSEVRERMIAYSTNARKEGCDPFSYWERIKLLKTGLKEINIREYCIIPFFLPEVYDQEFVSSFLPPYIESLFYITDKDDWEKVKAKYYNEKGAKTKTVPFFKDEERNAYSSSVVRKKIKDHEPWEHLTLRSVAEEMKKIIK